MTVGMRVRRLADLSEESSVDDVMEIDEIDDRICISSNAGREDDDLEVLREGDEEHVEERTFENVKDAMSLLRVNLNATVVLRDGLVGRVHQRLIEIQYQLTHTRTQRAKWKR